MMLPLLNNPITTCRKCQELTLATIDCQNCQREFGLCDPCVDSLDSYEVSCPYCGAWQ